MLRGIDLTKVEKGCIDGASQRRGMFEDLVCVQEFPVALKSHIGKRGKND